MNDNSDKIALLQRPHDTSLKSQLSLWIYNKLWPVPLYQLAICLAVGIILQSADVSFLNGIKSRLSIRVLICLELSLLILTAIIYIRRAFMRAVLSYTRWLYFFDGSEDKSFWASVWRFSMKAGMGENPTTFSHEAILPSLPLPSVSMTVERLLGSLAPYLGVDSIRYKTLKDQLNEYSRKQAAGSQRRLLAKKWTSGNYSTLWWETSVFLTNPRSLILNTNYCAVELREVPPTTNQAARGAVLLYLLANLRSLFFGGCIQPQFFKATVPLSMAQWKRVFSTTRIPLGEGDELWTFPRSHSQHAVIVYRGSFYKLDILSSWRRLFSPNSLQKQIEWILEEASTRLDKESETSWPLCCVTQLDRREWGAARCQHFAKGTNKQSLDIIEHAICILILDTELAPQSLSQLTATALDGNRGRVWADKGLNFMLSADCRLSVHAEQSALDPATLASVLDYLQFGETTSMYDNQGNAVGLEDTDIHSERPEKLLWETNKLFNLLDSARRIAKLNAKNESVSVLKVSTYGKPTVKSFGLSCDGFVQIALNYAFFLLTRKFALSAETVPTRLFSNGRTETVRPLTKEMVEFIRACDTLDKKNGLSSHSDARNHCIHLLKTACRRHQWLLLHAMTGKGVDRHLHALNLATQLRTYERCQILDTVLQMPWDMASCRIPTAADGKASWLIGLPPGENVPYTISYSCPDSDEFILCVSSPPRNFKGPSLHAFTDKLQQAFDKLLSLMS
ncbi:hypothetical protein AAHC03_05150 [Spirometra sp. Aus1]